MADAQVPGREQVRDAQPDARTAEKVMLAHEVQRVAFRLTPQRDAEPAADIFFEARRPGEALARMDHLREAAVAPVDAGPELPAPRRVLGDEYRRRNDDVGRQWQRRAD